MLNDATTVDETSMLEDMIRVLLRRPGVVEMSFRADEPPLGQPEWATPLTITSETTGRQWMLEIKAVECTDWNREI